MSHSQKQNKPKNNLSEGSPTPGEPLYIPVGKFGRPFSYRGAVIFYPEVENLEGIKPGKVFFLEIKQSGLKILTCKPHGRGLLLTLDVCATGVDAAKLTNHIAFMDLDALPLPKDKEYHRVQILGMEVFDDLANRLGFVEEIIKTGANDVYLVRNEKSEEVLLPATEDVILKVDLAQNRMTVHPPEWE